MNTLPNLLAPAPSSFRTLVNDKIMAISVAMLIIQKKLEPRKVNVFRRVKCSMVEILDSKNGAKIFAKK